MSNETGNNAQLTERRMKAYDLRLRGMTYRQIGANLGVSYTQAMNDVKARIDEIELPGVMEVRKQEIDRLMRYLAALDTRIDDGDDKALVIALKVSERLSKMLGVDAPQQISVEKTEVTQVDLEIQELIRNMNARNQMVKDSVVAHKVETGENTANQAPSVPVFEIIDEELAE